MSASFGRVHPPEVEVAGRVRDRLDEGAVTRLMESIGRIGLQTPISIRWTKDEDGGDVPTLVAGQHRLEAVKRLGIQFIDVIVHDDEHEARLWEISENLHRADLSVQERADHIAEWIKIVDAKPAHHAPVSKGGRGHESGINAASRSLGIDRTEAQRAVKIASIAPEARAAADDAGLNSQKARLEIASAAPDQQTAKVRELSERAVKPAPAIKNAFESEEDWRRALFTVWNRGAQEWREHALETIDVSPHVNTRFG